MQKSRIQKPSRSRQCTDGFACAHPLGSCITKPRNGRTPTLEETMTAALHLISLIIRRSRIAWAACSSVRLIGAFGGGCSALDAFSARGRHASYFNNGFVLSASAVGEMNARCDEPKPPSNHFTFYARDRLFTFRFSH